MTTTHVGSAVLRTVEDLRGPAGKLEALLNQSRAFQPQSRAVSNRCCRMMVADDLDPIGHAGRTMAMLEYKLRRLPARHKLDRPSDMTIVIPGHLPSGLLTWLCG